MIIEPAFYSSIQFGPFKIYFYGLMFVFGFLTVYFLTSRLIKQNNLKIPGGDIIGLLGILFIGMIIGARLGYVFIYWGKEYLVRPEKIFTLWEGGLSFHGGLLGIILSFLIYSKIFKISFWVFADILSCSVPLAVFLGKFGHFINGELWGRPTNGTWGVIFPKSGERFIPRHPVQLYEAVLEGLLIFIIINLIYRKKIHKGMIFGLFLFLLGIIRFFTEFFRQPDPQIGLIFKYFTMGQLLSVPLIIAGIVIFLSKKGLSKNNI